MGTSRASPGAPPKVPMVPPWVPPIPPEDPPPDAGEPPADAGGEGPPAGPEPSEPPENFSPSPAPVPVPIAPAARFRTTRTSLGKFATSGAPAAMRRGVGQYIRSGLGGTSTATRRFGGTVRTAGTLYGLLGGMTPGVEPANRLDRALLEGRNARDLIDAVVEAACPVDGTQDAEASRQSVNDALSELVEQNPDADLLNLTEDQRQFVTERFVGMDVFRRFMLDVGTSIHEKAPSISTAQSRLREARDYIRETISASFRKLRAAGQRVTGGRLAQLVQRALTDAFDVFLGYAE